MFACRFGRGRRGLTYYILWWDERRQSSHSVHGVVFDILY